MAANLHSKRPLMRQGAELRADCADPDRTPAQQDGLANATHTRLCAAARHRGCTAELRAAGQRAGARRPLRIYSPRRRSARRPWLARSLFGSRGAQTVVAPVWRPSLAAASSPLCRRLSKASGANAPGTFRNSAALNAIAPKGARCFRSLCPLSLRARLARGAWVANVS